MPPTAFPTALLTDAVARQGRGDLVGAQAIYWQILIDQPLQFDALHLLGVSKCQQGQQAEGAWFIGRALEQRPGDAAALFNRAMALAELHRHAEAIAGFDEALAGRPGYAAAWSSRGDSLQTLGRYAEAIESYTKALVLAPRLPGTLSNLGNALLASGQAARAIELFRQAIAGGADAAAVQTSIGRAHQELGDSEAARAAFLAACEAAPDAVQQRWLLALNTLPDVAETTAAVEASRPAFLAALDEIEAWFAADPGQRRDRLEHAWPFFLAYQERDNAPVMRRFGTLRARLLAEWRERQQGVAPVVRQPGTRQAGPRQAGPLRVALVSPHLYSHSVWHAITRGWFADHDPARIALHGFHTGPKSDDETEFARSRAASFTVGGRSLVDWVNVIRSVEPDVIVYPAIGMDVTCGTLAALRLAPVQVASWGHPETTGLPTIDAYLSAQAFEPADADAAYTERLVRLPRLGVSVRPLRAQAVAPDLVAPDLVALGLDPQRPLLLCPGTPFKYAPENDGVLSAIVRGVPDAQLVFFHAKTGTPQSGRLQRRLARHFASEGIDAARHCRLIPFQSAAGFHGLLGRADACLDTIGFSGFNTALQALHSGAAFVGYEGRFMRGRLGSGLLRTMGLDALVATNRAGFVDIAVRLATEPGYRDAMRARVAAEVSGLYDDHAAVGAWMDALENLVRQSCVENPESSRQA
jgi:predicted O-linked N-acetylglucosamine transferase (SPINDLY family)